MAYSLIADLQENVKLLTLTYTVAGTLTTKSTEAITKADKRVNIDVGNIIDVDLIPAIDASPIPITPDFIEQLSQYKAAEIALVRMQGARRQVTDAVTDITYWQTQYNDLLQSLISGMIPLELSDGTNIGTGSSTFENSALPDVDPRVGDGPYGTFLDKDELEDQRDTETGGYAG